MEHYSCSNEVFSIISIIEAKLIKQVLDRLLSYIHNCVISFYFYYISHCLHIHGVVLYLKDPENQYSSEDSSLP